MSQQEDILILEREYQFLLELVRENGRVIDQWPFADTLKAKYLAENGLAEWDGQCVFPTALGLQVAKAKARKTFCGTAFVVKLR
jgi:hypothetical protein